jgi:hypothetical protein
MVSLTFFNRIPIALSDWDLEVLLMDPRLDRHRPLRCVQNLQGIFGQLIRSALERLEGILAYCFFGSWADWTRIDIYHHGYVGLR